MPPHVVFFIPSGVNTNFCAKVEVLDVRLAVSCAMTVSMMLLSELISTVPTVSYENVYWPAARLVSWATMPITWAICASLLYVKDPAVSH